MRYELQSEPDVRQARLASRAVRWLDSTVINHKICCTYMKRILIFSLILILVLIIVWSFISYKGQKDFYYTYNSLPDKAQVVQNAKELIGTLYDPLMGRFYNIGGKLGFTVCSDAYGLSGFSIRKILEEDYKTNKNKYNSDNWNVPDNAYFHRRANNLIIYFKNNNKLYLPTCLPQLGDLAFYKRKNSKRITHVALVSHVFNNKYKLIESDLKTIFASEVKSESILERGWILVGFGRFY